MLEVLGSWKLTIPLPQWFKRGQVYSRGNHHLQYVISYIGTAQAVHRLQLLQKRLRRSKRCLGVVTWTSQGTTCVTSDSYFALRGWPF